MGVELFGYDIEDPMPLIGLSIWNIIVFIIALIVGMFVVRIVVWSLESSLRKNKVEELVVLFAGKLIRTIGFIVVFTFSLNFLGDVGAQFTAAMVGVSVVIGLVLGFSLGDTLSNIAAGFMIAINKPFRVGDYVETSGISGEIKAVGINATELDTPDNKRIIVPNKLVWGNNITNYTRHDTRRIDMEVGVSYADDLDKVKKITTKLISSHPKVLEDPAPQVEVKEMADSAVVFVVRPWVKTEDYWPTFFELKKAIKQRYDKAGISIPFPQMDVHMADKK